MWSLHGAKIRKITNLKTRKDKKDITEPITINWKWNQQKKTPATVACCVGVEKIIQSKKCY